MRGNRMLQAMEFPLLHRKPCDSPYVCMRWCKVYWPIGTCCFETKRYGDPSARVRMYDWIAFSTSGCMGYIPAIEPFNGESQSSPVLHPHRHAAVVRSTQSGKVGDIVLI